MSIREMEMFIGLLGLGTVISEGLKPKVYRMLEELTSRLYKDYPMLYTVSSQDLVELIPPPYYHRLEACVYAIAYYIAECQKEDDEGKYPPAPTDSLNELERYIKFISRLKEKERRERAALDAISPPFSDAQMYLNEDEHKSFLNSLSDAIDAYLARTPFEKAYFPDLWLQSCPRYAEWLSITQARKIKAALTKKAQAERERYSAGIEHSLKELKARLTTEKRPGIQYPKALRTYEPDEWCELTVPTKNEVMDWARVQMRNLVPAEVIDFLEWKCSYSVVTLPAAKYEVLGVPCLTWEFTTQLMVTLDLSVTGEPVNRSFHGITHSVKLQPEHLGFYHLGPVEWNVQDGFSTPLALLLMLSLGKMEDTGIKVITHDSPFTVYEVEGYDEGSVEIHGLFRKFIVDIAKGKSLSQGLLAAGVVDKVAADLVESKASIPLAKKESGKASHNKDDSGNGDGDDEVIQALIALGYKKSEALQMVGKAQFQEDMPLEKKVQEALKATVK